MSASPCPICQRSTEMERTETGAWVCRNPPCVYRRALERVQGGGAATGTGVRAGSVCRPHAAQRAAGAGVAAAIQDAPVRPHPSDD